MSLPIESVKFDPMPAERIESLTNAGFFPASRNAYVCLPVAGEKLAIRFGHQGTVYIVHVLGDLPEPPPWRYRVNQDFDFLLDHAKRLMDYYRDEMSRLAPRTPPHPTEP
jgi:hypothetical protein